MGINLGNEGAGQKNIIFVAVILAVLVLLVTLFYVYVFNKQKTITQLQADDSVNQVSYQARALISQSKINFPKISKITSVPIKNMSGDLELLVLGGGVNETLHFLNYEQNQNGFGVAYTINNSTVQQVQSRLEYKIKEVKFPWLLSQALRSNLFGLMEFEHSGADNVARMSLFQQNKDVRVVIQTLNKNR